MTCITIIENDLAFQVKVDVDGDLQDSVNISIYSVDQSKYLYGESILFTKLVIARDYVNEFTKRQAREIVKRYLRYEKGQ